MKLKISELKTKWGNEIQDSEIQRNLIWTDKFKVSLIESIFDNRPIGAITLFKQTDRDYYEIIDGKQRIYALEEYWKGSFSFHEEVFKSLPKEKREQFDNYELLVQISEGTFEDKVQLFEKINKNSVRLSDFELLKAQYYGELIEGVIEYVNTPGDAIKVLKVAKPDKDNPQGRGNREYLVLNIIRQNQEMHAFMKENYRKSFNDFLTLPKAIFSFIVDVFFPIKDVATLINLAKNEKYRKVKGQLITYKDEINNDIKDMKKHQRELALNDGWTVAKGYEAILETYITEMDKKVGFTKEEKQFLWDRQIKDHGEVICNYCGRKIVALRDAHGDHIFARSKGGKTNLNNAQLLHAYCNQSKGAK